jgi:hypothetical protein
MPGEIWALAPGTTANVVASEIDPDFSPGIKHPGKIWALAPATSPLIPHPSNTAAILDFPFLPDR